MLFTKRLCQSVRDSAKALGFCFRSANIKIIIAWLGRQSLFITFDEDPDFDIEEIRRLLDEDEEPNS